MTYIETDLEVLRSVAEELAIEAAGFVARRRVEVFGTASGSGGSGPTAQPAIQAKSTPTDPVTIVDTETEHLIRRRLADLRPGEHVLGEEGGGRDEVRAGRLTWVLDPIDGTVNFVYGIPAYAVSIAVQLDGQSLAGAVANVALGAVYSAALGQGAWVRQGLNPEALRSPLRCSDVADLSMALLGTGFAYSPQRRGEQGRIVAEILPKVRDVRRMGSCALDLCMVAAGQLDAYFEDGVNVWDYAAGVLIAAEAGATVWLPSADGAVGGPGQVVAAAPGVAAALQAELAD